MLKHCPVCACIRGAKLTRSVESAMIVLVTATQVHGFRHVKDALCVHHLRQVALLLKSPREVLDKALTITPETDSN